MKESFTEIYKKEKNENTALLLMLGIISEKISEITAEIKNTNKLTKEILDDLKTHKNNHTKEIIIIEPLTPEDYME